MNACAALLLALPWSPAAPGAQAASSFVALETVTPAQTANLVLLGKLWGFLKYHHPRVTAGELDWDAQLFELLPLLLEAADEGAGRATLLTWCGELGEPRACAPCAEPVAEAEAHLQPRLAWLDDAARLGPELSAYLRRVHANRPAGARQHHVSFAPGVGNPIFANEEPYPEPAYPDAGLRLLALFRLWNIVEYWFPYRDLIEEDWDDVLAEFVPRLVAARDRDGYALALVALIARIHDTHANLWNALDVRPPRGAARLPVVVRFVEGRATVVEPFEAPATALRRGDVLLALDGRPVEALVEEMRPYYAASNEAARHNDMARSLTVGAPGPVKVRLERDGAPLELEETRVTFEALRPPEHRTHDLPGPTFRLLAPEVGYLKLSSIRAADVPAILASADGTRGLVIDVRNYPGEFVVFALGRHLVRERTPFACFTVGLAANPGAFAWRSTVDLTPKEPAFAGRVAILVDETSLSQAEYTAMAFRVAPGAVVVGSQTAGADGNYSEIVLPGGLRTGISGIGVFTPERGQTQRTGIVPDVEARPTLAGVRAGRDEVLEAALRELLGPEAEAQALEIARAARASSR